MSQLLDFSALEKFIVQAKAATYVGGAGPSDTSRAGEHLLTYHSGAWSYQDSYVGGADFCGQETVRFQDVPVWSMVYYAHLLRPELFDAATAGRVIKQALTAMYARGRFLGGWTTQIDDVWSYADTSTGDVTRFSGIETIDRDRERMYELHYVGGIVFE